MIERRVQGIANLFVGITTVAACVHWLLLDEFFDWIRMNEEANLLSPIAYLIILIIGAFISWRSVTQLGSILVALDWAGAMRLAIRQVLALAAVLFTAIVVLKDPGISRIFLGVYLASVWLILAIINRSVPRALARSVNRGKQRSRTLVAVPIRQWQHFEAWIERQQKYGTEVVGLLDLPTSDCSPPTDTPTNHPVFTSAGEAISQLRPHQIIVLTTEHPIDRMRDVIAIAHEAGCQVYFYNDYADRLGIPLQAVTFDGKPFLSIGDEPLEDPFNRTLKRTVDLLLAVPIAILLLPPLFLLVALMQRRESPGPVLFSQMRTGRRGAAFKIFKFRTMDVSSAQAEPRKFPFGAFLRRTSLDELPQILNVLRNEMSMVGPRPHMFDDDTNFSRAVRIYRMRFFVKPGITGLAQSRGYRGEITAPEDIKNRLDLDLIYINEWSPWLDVAIISRTIKEIFIPPDTAK